MIEEQERIYDKDEIKEIGRRLRKIGKKVNYFDSLSPKVPKTTIENLLTIKNEPFYSDYLDIGHKYIQKALTFQNADEYLQQVYYDNKDIFVGCHKEELLHRSIQREVEREIHETPPTIGEQHDTWEHIKKETDRRLRIELQINEINDLPCIKKEKILSKTYDKLKAMNNDQAMQDQISLSLNIFGGHLHADHLCLVERDDTSASIKHKANNFCDFERPIIKFIDNFQEVEKNKTERNAWARKYISHKITKKYYNTLKEIVNKTEVRAEIKGRFVRSFQYDVTFAIDSLPKYKTERERLEKAYYDIRSDPTKRLERQSINKEQQKISGILSSLRQTINRYWDQRNNKYNDKNIESDAESYTEETVNRFVYKNTEKMSPILVQREDCVDFTHDLQIKNGTIQGDIKISCTNGDMFRVNNQLVFVENRYGTDFTRFPTTFHDIKINNEDHKMESEQWMNEIFAKKKAN